MQTDNAGSGPIDAIAGEREYATVHELLSWRRGALPVLRKLMRLFESYRAARKYGWSRPWNKGGLRSFLAVGFVPFADATFTELALAWADVAGAPTPTLHALAADPAARGFVFLHERFDASGDFEGFTLSFGRVSALGKRHRDRVDIVVERTLSPLSAASAPEDVFVRVYDDPFLPSEAIGEGFPPCDSREAMIAASAHPDLHILLVASLAHLQRNALDRSRHWTHWTQSLIDSFGPRLRAAESVWFRDPAFARTHAQEEEEWQGAGA